MKAQRFIQSIGIMIALVAGGVVLLSSQTSAHILEHNSSIIFQNKSTLSVGAWAIDNSGAVRDWLSIGVASPGWTIRGIADFNKDQIPDILLQNNETRTLSVWTWDGTKATGWLTIGTPEPDWEVVGVGDFSRDGQADILLYNTSTHAVGAWRMDGSTIAGWIPINEGGPHRAGWTVRGVGDFNGDFIADILWQNDATRALVVWLWDGTQITAARTITTLAADWEIRGIHDFDNDGHQDILLYNSTTRAVVVWRLHENQIIGSMRVKGTIGSDWAIYGVAGSFTPTPVDRALRLTQKVRHMADKAAIPFQGTPLAEVVKEFHRASATCGVQSITLVRLLSEAQLGEAHTSQLAFDPNGFETHVVVEWYNPEQQEWIVLDSTYGVVVTRLRDGKWATIENVKQAVLQQDWASLGYVFLTQWEDSLVRQSYIDYPLNYLSSYGGPAPGNYKLGVGNSVLSYLEAVPFPLNTDQPDFYILRNPAGTQKEVVVDGVHTLVQFNGVDATSRILQKVRSIYPSEDSSSELRLYRVKRFVFPYDNVVAPTHASFLYPTDGARDANPAQPFRWTNVSGALAYYLYVGTTPGAKNVVNTGEIQATSYTAPSLPVGQTLYARIHTKLASGWQYSDVTFVAGTGSGSSKGTLYARIWTKHGGLWRYFDVGFTQQANVEASQIITPANGSTGFNVGQPFEWTNIPLARGYRLEIGTKPGASNLHDSGEITVTRRLAPNLPIGPRLYGRLSTRVGEQWQATNFTFTVANNTVGADDRITAALWAAGFVRGMADISNLPFAWTPLWNRMYTGGKTVAFCGDYAEILVGILAEVNVGTEARVRQVLFYPNSYDGHILNVIRDESDRWVVIDPTFALAAKRQSDGAWATAEDISEATRLQAWDTISYIPARPEGTFYAENYYIDYPLLFLNVDLTSIAAPALPYLEEVPLPIDGHGFSDIYILQCMNASDQTFLLDGMTTTMSCPGPEHLTKAFSAGSIAPLASAGSDFRIYQLRRFVFP